jgi:hypothetical protein
MPFHQRTAYKGDNTDCYDTTAAALGEKTPPRARSFLRDAEIDSVVGYVIENLKGRGAPTNAECVAFWGEGSRQCN